MKDNKLLKSKWFQVIAFIFLVVLIGSIYEKAAGWFVMASALGLTMYQFFINKKFKERKLILKIGIGFMLLMMFFIGISMSNPLTAEQKLATEQQKVEKQAAKEAAEQAKLDDKKADESKKAEDEQKNEEAKTDGTDIAKTGEVKPTEAASESSVNGQLKVHFIDVGQADSILVQQGNYNMLIDAGNNGDAQTIKSYLDNQGVKSLDVVVGTHAHEDHIGSMDYVINSFQVGKVYFPKQTSTTKTFEDFVSSVKNKELQLTAPSVGSTFKIGDATATILAPNGTGYEDANDYSIVIKLVYGNTSFLLTGDAEAVSESQMLSKGLDLSATVLKIGHHGSKSSTGQGFLDKVNPKYAVISVGKGNSYGHPTQDVMNRLKSKNIPVYRTDENGTIVAISDGSNVSFNINPGSYNGITSSSASNSAGGSQTTPAPTPAPTPQPTPTPATSSGTKVYWLTTKTSKSYHKDPNCSYIVGKTEKVEVFKTQQMTVIVILATDVHNKELNKNESYYR